MSTSEEKKIITDDKDKAKRPGSKTYGKENGRDRDRELKKRKKLLNKKKKKIEKSLKKVKKDISFVPATKGMNNHIFQCAHETDDRNQYNRTVEELIAYSRKTFEYGGDIAYILKNESFPDIPPPPDMGKTPTHAEKYLWEQEMKEVISRKRVMDNNLSSLYAVIIGQCSQAMRDELQSADEFEDIDTYQDDVIQLLQLIRSIFYKFHGRQHPFQAMCEAQRRFYTCRQQPNESVSDYKTKFDAVVKSLEYCGGTAGSEDVLAQYVLTMTGLDKDLIGAMELTDRQRGLIHAARIEAKERLLSMAFLNGADQKRFKTLLVNLENDFLHGQDKYPTTRVQAFMLLQHFRHSDGKRAHGNVQSKQTQLQQVLDTRDDTDGDDESEDDEPDRMFLMVDGEEDTTTYMSESNPHEFLDASGMCCLQFALMHVCLAQAVISALPKTWVLLDSQSTVSIFGNRKMLVNIRKIPPGHKPLTLHTNGGILRTDMVGDLLGFGTVWFHEDSLANILSLSMVMERCRVTMDTAEAPAMILHRKNGSTIKFERRAKGLFAYDASNKSKTTVSDYSFVETVAENKTKFSSRQVNEAEKARKLMSLLEWPSHDELIHILQQKDLKNAPVEHMDAQRAKHIFGPEVNSIKGKAVRRQPLTVTDFVPIPLPVSLMNHHKYVTLCVDIFYVHKLPFLHTISRGIMFRTQLNLKDRHAWTVQQGINTVIQIYAARGFEVKCIHADNEFKCLEHEFEGVNVNCCGEGQHVPEVERSIRTVKERTRCRTSSLPFRYYPKQLAIGIVNNAVKWLNAFPNKHAVCTTLSPRAIVLGQDTDFNVDCRVEIGTYCQITENNNPTNSQEPRSRDALALHSTGNRQGTYFFLTLDTWEKVHRSQWTEIAMPDVVIRAVNSRGRKEGMAAIKRVNTFLFEWRPRIPMFPEDNDAIEDSDADNSDSDYDFDSDSEYDSDSDDDEYLTSDDEVSTDEEDGGHDGAAEGESTGESESDDASEYSEDSDDDDNNVYDPHNNEVDAQMNDTNNNVSDESNNTDADDNNDTQTNTEISQNEDRAQDIIEKSDDRNEEASGEVDKRNEEPSGDVDHNHKEPNTNSSTKDIHEPDEEYVEHGYNTRRSKHTSKQHLFEEKDFIFAQVAEEPTPENKKRAVEAMVDMLFVQLGNDGVDMHKDMPMRKGLKVFGEKAVEAIIKEVSQFNDLEAFIPVHADKITHLERKAALRALTFVKMKRCGRIKGRTVADGRPQRKIYNKEDAASPALAIESLLLSLAIDAVEKRDVATCDIAGAYLKAYMDDYVLMKFEGEMVDYVVATNPELYEKYVTIEKGRKVLYVQLNKALYGCMRSALLWYLMFVGHLKDEGFEVNPYDMCVANKMIDGKQFTICWYVDDLKLSHVDPKVVDSVIDEIEKKFGKMNTVRGKEHVYVGCNITFKDEDVEIDNIDYLKECIEAFGEDVSQRVSSVATKYLFTVRKSERLGEEKSALFHSIVMKLLWISKRSRPDIETALSFLCTRTHKSTKDDWFKLKRVLQFVNQTINDKRILSASNLGMLNMWIDASYAVHEDMRSHTGAVISVGKGTVYCSSSKQKINVKSSTEGEVVGASDKLPQGIWSKYFLESQGYAIENFNFYEDNQAAMRMLKNGRMSCGQKSRHINIRYFFITDRIREEEISVKHCPTAEMLADYFTKPLQGSLFRAMREVIMGYKPISSLSKFETKECVGSNEVLQNSENHEGVNPTKNYRSWSDVVKNIKSEEASPNKRSPIQEITNNVQQTNKAERLETPIVSRQSRMY